MARGVGGFASGLSRGIRTGMEMRRFKREEDEYNFQKDQREEFQDIMQGIPTKGDLNTVAPVEDMNVDGYAIPAETFTDGQPQMQHGQQQVDKMRQRINSIVDPDRRDAALAELNRAQLGAASMAITAAVNSKDPYEKKRWLNQAHGFTGAPGEAPFIIGEDGAVTHNIPELTDEEGNPMPIDLILGNLLHAVKNEPEKVFETFASWREQKEREAREDAEIERQQKNTDAELEIARERNDLTAIANDQTAAYYTDRTELARLGLEADLAETNAELARITAAATGLNAEALQDGIKEIRALEKDFLANYSGPGVDVIPANINQWRSAGATLLALNLGRAQPAQVIDAATRFMEDKLGVGEPLELDVFQTPQGPAVMWKDPLSDTTRVRIPFSMVAQLEEAGRLEEGEFEKLREVFMSGGGAEEQFQSTPIDPTEGETTPPGYAAGQIIGDTVKGGLDWRTRLARPLGMAGDVLQAGERATSFIQGLRGAESPGANRRQETPYPHTGVVRRGGNRNPWLEEEQEIPHSYTGTVRRGQ